MTARYDGEEFRQRFGPWAVVAGGSDGIGEAFARELARRGLSVAPVARRKEPLEALAAALRGEHGVEARPIRADLTAPDALETLAAETADLDVGIFVYNAGANRAAKKLLDTPLEELTYLMELNCRGPLRLAHHFGGRLRARGRGGLVVVSSMACLAGSAYQANYCAGKAFETILAEGLWHELAPENVDVLGVLASSTRTPTVLALSDKFEGAMDPAEVATGALDHLGRGPNWVPGAANRAGARAMWPAPRVPLIEGMSQSVAELFEVPHQSVEGVEFDAS